MASQQRYDLDVQARKAGKHFSRQSRVKNLIPAVAYGPKIESHSLLVDGGIFDKLKKTINENAIIHLKSADAKINNTPVLVKDIQRHPVNRRLLHIDFFAPDMTANVRVSVEIRFEGKPIGTKEGGLLQIMLREIEVECKPTDIPQFLTADISNLNVGDSLHSQDLQLPNGVKATAATNLTLATVTVMEEEVVAAPVAAATDAAAAGAPGAAPAAGAAAAPGATPAADAKKEAPAKK